MRIESGSKRDLTNRNAIKLDGPSSLIAAVPHLVGFQPANSLVLVVMSGPRSRVVLTVRADLPSLLVEGELTQIFEPIVRATRLASGEQLVAICYPPDLEFDSQAVLTGLATAIAELRIEIADFLVVFQDSWHSLFDDEQKPQLIHCASGSPSPAQAALVLEGRAPLVSREALVESFARLPAKHPMSLSELDLAQATECPTDLAVELLLDGRSLTKAESAELVASLQLGDLRDALIARILKTAEASEFGLASNLRGVCERLRPLVQGAPTGAVAPVATTLAALAWQAGEGAIAACAIERALGDNPDYRLAILVQAALLTAMPPWLGRDALMGTP